MCQSTDGLLYFTFSKYRVTIVTDLRSIEDSETIDKHLSVSIDSRYGQFD